MFLLGLTIVIYIVLIFSNPGKHYSKNPTNALYQLILDEQTITDYCSVCAVKVYPFQKHCTICDICIEGFDHHCYWINNCIGMRNVFLFRFFLLIVFINLMFLFIISIMSKFNYKIFNLLIIIIMHSFICEK